MRLRFRFRFNAETGEVETFLVEDVDGRAPAADHDARHDRAAADIGRVVERHALVEQIPGGAERPPKHVEPHAAPPEQDESPARTEGRPLRG
ncbi:MAG TPA: hypothetical protein VGM10_03765 [Actinocrinis sp.]|jgi:hypothetical protein